MLLFFLDLKNFHNLTSSQAAAKAPCLLHPSNSTMPKGRQDSFVATTQGRAVGKVN